MIISHTGHSIETSVSAIPNSHNWAASVFVSWDAEGNARYTSFMVQWFCHSERK